MPAKVKVRVLAGRNLPVMDRSSDTTDAYVEVKLGNTIMKTDIYRKSLNPQWNSEWFIFEVHDSELQDEPLQIRLMDHDTYSSNDAIGKVYVDLNPLLFAPPQPSQGKNPQEVTNSSGAAVMSGWLPVYDTMHGIRGEVNILVKVDLFSDFNKFRQSSCGVQFFFTSGIPSGFRCNSIIGFVEELVVNDDPEYQWIDKIRTPRASNEARQTLFSKLSGELQRRIGLKVLEQGGNAVIGYRQCFDLEGESGIVVRGIGSVVSLSRIIYDPALCSTLAASPSPHREFISAQREIASDDYTLENLYLSVPYFDELMPVSLVRFPKCIPQSSLLNQPTCLSAIPSVNSSIESQFNKAHNILSTLPHPQWLNLMVEARNRSVEKPLCRNTIDFPYRRGVSLPSQKWYKKSTSKSVLPPLYNTQVIKPMSSLSLERTKPQNKSPRKGKSFPSTNICNRKNWKIKTQKFSQLCKLRELKSNSCKTQDKAKSKFSSVKEKKETNWREYIRPSSSAVKNSLNFFKKLNAHPSLTEESGSGQTLVEDQSNEVRQMESYREVTTIETLFTGLYRSNSDPTLNQSLHLQKVVKELSSRRQIKIISSEDSYSSNSSSCSSYSESEADDESNCDSLVQFDPNILPNRKTGADSLTPPVIFTLDDEIPESKRRINRKKNYTSFARKKTEVLPDIKLVPSTPLCLRQRASQTSSSEEDMSSSSSCMPSSVLSLHDSNSDPSTTTDLCRSGLSPSTTASPKRRSRKTSGNLSRSPQLQDPIEVSKSTSGAPNHSPTHSIKMASPSRSAGVYINRRSSDSELSITPKGGSLPGSGGSSSGKCGIQNGIGSPRPLMSQESFDNLIYPFLTMKSFPPGFVIHIGGTVCSRSVQLLDRGHPEEAETRDSWWSDLRTEIRSHARSIGCNVVIGYEEFTSISDEVCLLNAVGTAAVINVRYQELDQLFSKVPVSVKCPKDAMSISIEKKDTDISTHMQQSSSGSLGKIKDAQQAPVNRSYPSVLEDAGESSSSAPGILAKPSVVSSGNRYPPCRPCHIPYTEEANPLKTTILKCAVCKKDKVPDVLLTTIELPPTLPTIGRGCLIQSRVIRAKRDLKGELNAREMSDAMPFLEYDLHKQLYQKLMMKGLNAIFSLRMRVTIGEKFIVGIGTGTGVFLKALPPPSPPRLVSKIPGDESRKAEMQKKIYDAFETNKQFYGLNVPLENFRESRSESKGSDSEDSEDDENELPSSAVNKDMYDLDLNDLEDVEMVNLLLEECPPKHLVAVSTTQVPPGLNPEQTVNNIQMFSKVWRSKVAVSPNRIVFSSYFDNILQSVYFKLRNLSPCVVSSLHMSVDLPEDDEVQVSMYAMVLGLGAPAPITPSASLSKNIENAESKKSKQDDAELMFRMEEVSEEPQPKVKTSCSSFPSIPSNTSFSSESSKSSFKIRTASSPFTYHLPPRSDHFGIEITPLSFIPGATIEKYLGNLNFFFIRESTSIKENGGLSGFMGSFVTEVLALVRAHVAAIGGNAMLSYFLSECVLYHSPHKNQGQCLINVGGDVVHVQYTSTSTKSEQDAHVTNDQIRGNTPIVFE